MRITKLIFSVLIILGTIFTASGTTSPSEKKLRDRLNTLIQQSEALSILTEDVAVSFLINKDQEIIVVSTSSEANDVLIRQVLNQQTAGVEGIAINQIYTLPIRIQKK